MTKKRKTELLQEIVRVVSEHERFAIFSHEEPDGDAIGSQIALALADAFDCGVNELPLSFILSWYEQKAVCILLTLLHLGIKNIRIGPSLPAFIGPNVLNVLVETFGLTPITTASEDLQSILGGELGDYQAQLAAKAAEL